DVRRQVATGALVSLSGADPLNLAGILTPGAKLPALTGNRVLYRDGIPLALLQGDDVQFLQLLDLRSEGLAQMALLGHSKPAPHLRNVGRRQRSDAREALPGNQGPPGRFAV